MGIQYLEVALTEVLQQYAEGFKVSSGEKILKIESFVDTQKGVVLFKLFIEDRPAPSQ